MTDRPVKQINAFTTQATPANGDFLLIQEAAGNLYKKTTLQNVIATVGIVVDLTPVLGGNLDTNNKSIINSIGQVTINDTLDVVGGDIRLDNNETIRWKDNVGTYRPIVNVNATDVIDIGAVTTGWGSTLRINSATDYQFIANRLTSDIIAMRIKATGNIIIGTNTEDGLLHVDQDDTAGAKPVITLTQDDVDEDFWKFIGTSDTNVDRALVDAANFTTPGSIVGWLKINIQDLQGTAPITDGDYYIPFYSAPTA